MTTHQKSHQRAQDQTMFTSQNEVIVIQFCCETELLYIPFHI